MSVTDAEEHECADPWQNETLLCELYVDEQLAITEIAERFGCHPSTVGRWIKRFGIERNEPWNDEGTLRELYIGEELSSREVASELGCAKSTVLDRLAEFGIERASATTVVEFPLLHDEEWLREQYCKKRRPVGEIAKDIGCSQPATSEALKKHGIESRGRKIPFPVSDDELVRMYVAGGRTLVSLADDFGVSYGTIRNRLVELGAEIITERQVRSGEDSHWWNGGWEDYYGPTWPTQREKERKSAGYQCRVCGMTDRDHKQQYGSRLPVHHIIRKEEFRKENGELDYKAAHAQDNLMCLCKPHHRKWEGIPLRPQFA